MTGPWRLDGLLAIARGEQAADWQPFRDGIERLPLHAAGGDGVAAALLRYQPGARAPRHRHTGHEHILVLTGSQRDAHGTYPAGSFVVNPPGSEHWVVSDEGCVALLIWERPVAFLEE